MKEMQLRKLTRQQLSKMLRANVPHVSFNKRTTLQQMRDKLNILGGDFAWIRFDNNFVIQHRV